MNRFIRTTLYQLKREYGKQLTLYRESASTNMDTGARTRTVTANHVIKHAVMLPDDWKRKFSYALSFVAANKNFTYGGFFDRTIREIMIDAEDLPTGFKIKNDDYVVIDSKRYNIAEVIDLEEAAGWIISAKHVSGEQPRQDVTVAARDRITFGEEVDGST